MATYVYDDFRVTFTPRTDGDYDMRAVDGTGAENEAVFRVPLSDAELERAVLGVVRSHARGRPATDITRDVGGAGTPRAPVVDAEHLGATLANALLVGPVGTAYDAARATAAASGRGLRLSLSLAGAPALLSVPWEFVYKRPRFLASQRHTPLVRLLDTGTMTPAATIDAKVRILGIIASPKDLSPLAVDDERRRVEQAVATVRELGRVQLDWLEPATTKSLREALRDGSYHVLHFVGHSDFTADGEGLLYLEDEQGASSVVDETLFANLLSDQDQLRLVVLNSCEGARTTTTDPYAGVATTLISLGVPAVVAMQFEISDRAAVVFAEELYTNLIGRQAPIDAAVSEARKAVYSQVDKIEWATPVLFVRDPEIELFRFGVPAAPLPPPPPPEPMTDERSGEHRAQPTDDGTLELDVLTAGGAGANSTGDGSASGASTRDGPKPRGRLAMYVAAAVAVVALAAGSAFVVLRDDDPSGATTTLAPEVSAISAPAARPRTGFLAVQVEEGDGDVHQLTVDPSTGDVGTASDQAGSHDTEPDWDRATNRLVFHRAEPSPRCIGLCYVVPGNNSGDAGKKVAQLVPFTENAFQHAPTWAAEGTLYYARTANCTPGAGCQEEIRRATFTASDDGTGFGDALRPDDDIVVAAGFEDVRDLDADPQDADRLVIADGSGVAIVDRGAVTRLATTSDVSEVTYSPDGNRIYGLGTTDGRSSLEVWNGDGEAFGPAGIADIASAFVGAAGGDLLGLAPERTTASSITPGGEGDELLVLLDDPGDGRPPIVGIVAITGRGPSITSVSGFPSDVLAKGQVQAIAL